MARGVIGEKKSSQLTCWEPLKEEEDLRKQIKGGERVVIFHPSTFIFLNSWRHLFFPKRITKKVALKSKILKKKKKKNCGNLYANEEEKKEEGAVGWPARPVRLCCRWCFCPSVRPPDKHGASLREPPPVTFFFFALFLLCPRVYSRELHDGFDINSCKRRSLFIQRCSATEGGGWPIHRKKKNSHFFFFSTLTKKN